MPSYIPAKEADLGPWVENFSTLISATPSAYGLMASDAAAISSPVNLFLAALTLVQNPATKTKATVTDKNAKKSAMLVIVRQYATVIKNNLGISNEAKIALGLHVNDTSRTPVPAPTTVPLLNVSNGEPLTQVIRFNDSAAPDRKSKPAGAQGMLLRVIVSATPLASADPAAFPAVELVTRQNHTITFDPADKAKTAYYLACWYTAAGLMGPWSEIAQQLIA